MSYLNVAKGLQATIFVNEVAVAGSTTAHLIQNANRVDITDKIVCDWAESLSGIKSWSIKSAGNYVVNAQCFSLLQEAFVNSTPVQVNLAAGATTFSGEAIITEFPLSATYNDSYKYNITLVGSGALRTI